MGTAVERGAELRRAVAAALRSRPTVGRKKIARNTIFGYFKCIYIWAGQASGTEQELARSSHWLELVTEIFGGRLLAEICTADTLGLTELEKRVKQWIKMIFVMTFIEMFENTSKTLRLMCSP